MNICRVQSQVPFSGVCAHLRDLEKMGQAHTIEKLRGFAYKPLIYRWLMMIHLKKMVIIAVKYC